MRTYIYATTKNTHMPDARTYGLMHAIHMPCTYAQTHNTYTWAYYKHNDKHAHGHKPAHALSQSDMVTHT